MAALRAAIALLGFDSQKNRRYKVNRGGKAAPIHWEGSKQILHCYTTLFPIPQRNYGNTLFRGLKAISSKVLKLIGLTQINQELKFLVDLRKSVKTD